MIKIFGVSGSPRKGSTDYIVNEALKYLEEKYNVQTRYFPARGKHLNLCIHCDYCIRAQRLHPQRGNARVLRRPGMGQRYHHRHPGVQGQPERPDQDHAGPLRAVVVKDPEILRNKVGAALAVGGDRVGGQEIALQSIHHFYIISEMIPAGGGSFGANPGGTFQSQDRIAEGAAEDGGAPLHAQDHEPDDEDAGGGRGEDIPKKG